MQTEIEAKFLDINHAALRRRLNKIGAELVQPWRLTRRNNYDFAGLRLAGQRSWVRLRDEGDKVTLSYKHMQDRSLHGMKEVSVVVDDFEQTHAFLAAIGLEVTSHQETKRESWRIGGVEVELDEWPWVKPFVEIEGPDELSVRTAAKRLGLNWLAAVHGSVEVAYRAEYGVTDDEFNSLNTVRFDDPLPELLAAKRSRE